MTAADNARRGPTMAGLPMKWVSLFTLTFQNSGLILVMHYSRIMPEVDGQKYIISTAVLLNEVIKLLISLVFAIYELLTRDESQRSSPSPGFIRELGRAVFSGDSWKLAIPAMLYTLQNSLQYVAVSNLNAATYQVLSQLKILTTAIFSVILLRRSLSGRQWLALLVLMMGVAIVQLDPETVVRLLPFQKEEKKRRDINMMHNGHLLSLRDTDFLHSRAAAVEEPTNLNGTVGLIAVAIGCMLSGLAGVYFEKVLKDKSSASVQTSLWIRNIQLSFYSLFPALFVGVFLDRDQIQQKGFFVGYNWVVWLAISFQATGGILVALVVKYADNIAKNFATSFSIIVSFLASVYLFNFAITWVWLLGTCFVIGATFLFNFQSAPKPAPPPVVIINSDDIEAQKHSIELDHVAAAEKPLLSGSDDVVQQAEKSQPQQHSKPLSASEMENSQSKREA